MNADKFISHLTPDVRFRFANMDPAIGHAAVKEGGEGFWTTIDGLTHHILKVHEVGDTVIVQIDVEYRRKDGKSVTVPNCDVLGFAVANSDALDAAETELERSGISVHRGSPAEARSRRVREFIGFDDPFGNRVELVNQQETVARPVALSRGAGIAEFGHLCLDAPDVHEAHRFWSPRFHGGVSDWLGDAACLMRIDPVHHKLAVLKGGSPGLCHMNFQVETIDDGVRN